MTTLDTPPVLHAADALVERLFGALLATMDLHAVYLGDRLGFYRALAPGPLTSAELAARTATAERYAREWLEQQAVTGILDTPGADAGERRYTLPAAHVAPLTDELDLGHVTPFAQATIGFVKQVDHLVEAFRTGGGVSWAQLGADAREGQAGANRPLFLGPLGREYLPSIPDVDAALRAGGRVADVGSGWAGRRSASRWPTPT